MIVYLNDTGFLWNFAVVDRLDLIQRLIDSRSCEAALWVREVEQEVSRRIPEHSEDLFAMLGPPLDPTNAERSDTQLVRGRFFEREGDGSSQHLGESECIAVGVARYSARDVVACTEDGAFREWCHLTATAGSDANAYTNGRKWTPIVTRNVLAIAVNEGWMSENERRVVTDRLRELDRPLLPARSRGV